MSIYQTRSCLSAIAHRPVIGREGKPFYSIKPLRSQARTRKIGPMQITLNGQPRQLAENTTIEQLIAQLGLEGKRYAVEVNQAIVPRSRHTETPLRDGDTVEVIQAIGGG